MYAKNILAAGALLSVAVAVPMEKRDLVWITETDVVIATVEATVTVWADATESTPTSHAHYGHGRPHSSSSSSSTTAVVTSAASSSAVVASSSSESTSESSSVAPAPSSTYVAPSSSSVYVAPTSSSVYVAPTTTSVYVAPTTTSVYVAPTTTSVYVAPTTTSVYVAPTTSAVSVASTTEAPAPSTYVAPSSSTSAAAASSSAASTSSGTTYTGDITYYDVGMGSCGNENTDGEAVVAIPTALMANGANPNFNPKCGQYITISYAGATHQAKVVDTCGGCIGDSIDLSPSLFAAVAPQGDGRVHNVEWWPTDAASW